MKRNKVLLGLFAGVLALMGGSVRAQQDTNFVEIGPINVGGHVTSLLADRLDGTTIYAGSATGGLFVRSDNQTTLQSLYTYRGMSTSLANNHDIWHWVPWRVDGKDVAMPISCLTQCSDNTIFIGTGSDEYTVGSTYAPMSVMGCGIFCYNPATCQFNVIPGTVPTSVNDDFASVRKIDLIEGNDGIYLFAVTKGGLYRIHKTNNQSWSDIEVTVDDRVVDCADLGGSIDQFVVVRQLKIAFFSVGSQLYKIGNLKAYNLRADNMSSSNDAFGTPNTALKIAVAPSDPTYIYVMTINGMGMMDAVYLTRDLQTWQPITTSTVRVYSMSAINDKAVVSGDGRHCGTIFVDENDPTHVFVGGSSIWSGHSYVPGSYYQWTKESYCEQELNYGNYMASVFRNPSFVHSGIHQIICAPRMVNGTYMNVYYIATDGGVFRSYHNMTMYEELNRGLNAMQTNSIAVAPDASVISGAHNGACPLIEARAAYNGGQPDVEWYDDGTHGNMNHDAIITWKDNGGMVAASMFQRYKPTTSRTIFVSSNDNQFGRAYADYMDYNQTQTWTEGQRFMSSSMVNGQAVSFMSLWETDHDTIFNDSITVRIDTLGYVRRDINGDGILDTMWFNNSSFQILAGDSMTVMSRAQGYYPFEYGFTFDTTAGTVNQVISSSDTLEIITPTVIKVKNPMQSRMLMIGSDAARKTCWTVWMSWRSTDFSKVWMSELPDNDTWEGQQLWTGIYIVNNALQESKYNIPRAAVMSADGRMAYIAVNDTAANKSMIVRVKGFDSIDYSKTSFEVARQSQCFPYSSSSVTRLVADTMFLDLDSNYWIDRAISSMLVDTTTGVERIIITFEGYNDDYANVAEVSNPQGDWTISQRPISGQSSLPAYCAMVEASTGDLYVGTANGVWIDKAGSWSQYDHLRGLPVTSMVQQKAALKARHHIGHNGINPEYYLFPKTKWPGAIYFGTYGRGIFMDMTYVTDRTDAIFDTAYYHYGIPTVESNGNTSLSIFPNPVMGDANLTITTNEAGSAMLRIYDINGRCVASRSLGHVSEGEQVYTVSTEGMAKGMYLVNVIIGGHTSATKMMVR